MRVCNAVRRNCRRVIAFDSTAHQFAMHHIGAAHMTQYSRANRRHLPRASIALGFAAALLLSSSIVSAAHAQSLGYAPQDQGYANDAAAPQDEDSLLPDQLRRQ